jgi:hypothetical protein
MNATSESTQFGQIGEFATAQFMGTGRAGPVGDKIVQAHKMVESVGPKSGRQIGTSQHGA